MSKPLPFPPAKNSNVTSSNDLNRERATCAAKMPNDDPALVDPITWARTNAIHGLRKAPTSLSIQGRGYCAKRIGQMSVQVIPTFDGGVIGAPTREDEDKIGGEDNGRDGAAGVSGDDSPRGETPTSAYGSETRSAFPYEGKGTRFDNTRQSVHMALENYGLNCPVPAPPSPMRTRSALRRDVLLRMPRSTLSTNHDGQVDSLFDHDAEHFDTLAEAEDRYVKSGSAVEVDPQTGAVHVVKSKLEVDYLGESTKNKMSFRSRLFDPWGDCLRSN